MMAKYIKHPRSQQICVANAFYCKHITSLRKPNMVETNKDKHHIFMELLRVLDETRQIKLKLDDGKTIHLGNGLLFLC